MKELSEDIVKSLEDKFLGKKISVIDQKGITHVGICDFIGYNRFIPSWGFQVTVSRVPITNVDVKTIKLL
jgi:hypothetical protein